MSTSSALPSFRFVTSALPPREAYDAWRQLMSVTHEVEPADKSDLARFSAEGRAWRLGSLVVGVSRMSAHNVLRTARRVRTDQIDHYSLLVKHRGRVITDVGERVIEVHDREPYLLDMAAPLASRVYDNDTIAVMMPREVLDEVVPPFCMHGLVMRGALGQLLADHLYSLAQGLPSMTAEQAPHAARATRDMLAACLSPSREMILRARPQIELALLGRAKRHIERHLTSRELDPETICAALGISRSTLYRLFEPRGGVAAYIQGRRLERVHALLSDVGERRTISEIALEHGFTSETHFSWAFRRRFGYSPREARAGRFDQRLHDRQAKTEDAADYHQWIWRLQG